MSVPAYTCVGCGRHFPEGTGPGWITFADGRLCEPCMKAPSMAVAIVAAGRFNELQRLYLDTTHGILSVDGHFQATPIWCPPLGKL